MFSEFHAVRNYNQSNHEQISTIFLAFPFTIGLHTLRTTILVLTFSLTFRGCYVCFDSDWTGV